MNHLRRALALLVTSLFAACGGGGGGGGGGGPSIPPPTNFAYPSTDTMYLNGVVIAPNIPTFTGHVDTFSVSPPLPAGLLLHPLLGAVYGQPTEPEPRTVHTFTASNAGGSATASVTITVIAPPRYVYVLADDGTISIFGDDVSTGRLARRGYVAAAAGESGPEEIVIHPNQRFAYVPNLASGNISFYTIAPATGWLTAGDPVMTTAAGSHRIAIDPSGKWAFVAGRVSDDIQAFSITQTSEQGGPPVGSLTPVGSPIAAGTQPSALAFDPAGKYLFVALHGDPSSGAGSALAVFSFNASTGALTPNGSPFALASSMPAALAVDAVKNAIYVTQEGTSTVTTLHFNPSTGAINSLGADATGTQPAGVAAHPSGTFVYVANDDRTAVEGSVSIFKVDAASGDLSPAGSATCGVAPNGVIVDPTGKFAYVAGHDSNDLRMFKINASTGALTLDQELIVRAGPLDVAIVQANDIETLLPRFAYVVNEASNSVSAFVVNPGDGSLTSVGATIPTGTTPVSLAIDPQQRYVYVANQIGSTISIFGPDVVHGTLIELTQPAPVFGHPTHIVVDPSGRFVYVACRGQANPDAGLLLSFTIDQSSGALTPLPVTFVDARPTWVGIDPTGQYLYIACSGLDDQTSADIIRFAIPVTNGLPLNPTPSISTPAVSSLGFHPNGKYLYATMKGTTDATREFTIDPQTGVLTSVGTPVTFGIEPSGIELTPDGKHAYVAYSHLTGAGHVAGFQVDPDDGSLMTPPDFTQDGPHPTALAIDPTGRILYVTNVGSNDVSVMLIDPTTGSLLVGTPVMCGLAPSAVAIFSALQ